MRSLPSLLTLAVLLPTAAGAGTGTAPPFMPPVGYSLEASVKRDSAGNPVEYGATGATANWTVAQWATISDIGKLSPVPGVTGQWTAATSDSSVSVNMPGATPVIGLAQDGAALPCETAGGAPYEADMFLSPNTDTTPTYPSGRNVAAFPTVASMPSLAQVTSLPISGQYELLRDFPDTRGPACSVNQSIALVSLVFSDTAMSPYQVFYYQLQITQLCVPPPVGVTTVDYSTCLYYQQNTPPFWFQEAAPTGKAGSVQWGFDDYLTSFGHALIDTPGTYALAFNPAGRVKALISGNSVGMDKTLGNWRLTGYYIGQQVWGGCFLRTIWNGFVPAMTYTD